MTASSYNISDTELILCDSEVHFFNKNFSLKSRVCLLMMYFPYENVTLGRGWLWVSSLSLCALWDAPRFVTLGRAWAESQPGV